MKILTVCGLGMGSSLILKINIEEILKKYNIKTHVEHIDISSVENNNADIIVTNSELVKNLKDSKSKLIIIKNFFDKDEIENAFKEAKII